MPERIEEAISRFLCSRDTDLEKFLQERAIRRCSERSTRTGSVLRKTWIQGAQRKLRCEIPSDDPSAMSAKALNDGLYFRRSELFSWVCCISIGSKLFLQQGEQLFFIGAAAGVFVDGEGDVLQFTLHFV